jgi:hypothetical protein
VPASRTAENFRLIEESRSQNTSLAWTRRNSSAPAAAARASLRLTRRRSKMGGGGVVMAASPDESFVKQRQRVRRFE